MAIPRRMFALYAAALLLALLAFARRGAGADRSPTLWEADPAQSRLFVQVFKDSDTIGSALSHDHVVLATGWRGRFSWNPGAPGACMVQFDVPVAGLVPDPPELRRELGYEGVLDEGQRQRVGESMRAEGQLHADAYPVITFRGAECTETGDGVRVVGDLTIRGTTHRVEVPVEVRRREGRIQARATFRARHTDFGFEPYQALFGTIRNADELRFVVEVTAAPADGA